MKKSLLGGLESLFDRALIAGYSGVMLLDVGITHFQDHSLESNQVYRGLSKMNGATSATFVAGGGYLLAALGIYGLVKFFRSRDKKKEFHSITPKIFTLYPYLAIMGGKHVAGIMSWLYVAQLYNI